jgi:two-component system NtrC family sensor kinase
LPKPPRFDKICMNHGLQFNIMDLQSVLSGIITRTNNIFRAEAGSVSLLEPGGQEIVIRAAVGAGAEAVLGLRLNVDNGVIGWVARHEEPALIPDVSQDDRFFQDVDQESGFQTHSILCVPMAAGGRVIGVIELMNMRPDYLNEDGVQILTVIAEHAALVIENVQLLAQTRQQAEEQAMLFETMAIITSDLALDTVLDAVSRQMVESIQADLCIISRWETTSSQLFTVQTYSRRRTQKNRPAKWQVGNPSFLTDVLQAQRPRIIDIEQQPGEDEQEWLMRLGVKALLLIPLIYRRQTVGLLEIGRQQAGMPITPRELWLGETMAAQAATAIEHAQLYKAAERRLAEANVLQEVMVAAASTLSFDQAVSGTIEALHRLLGIERLAFFLPESEDYLVAHPTIVGVNRPTPLRVRVSETAAGWVSRSGSPLLFEDVTDSSQYLPLANDTRSMMCVPVRVGDRVLAVLAAESPRPHAFSPADLGLFGAIAAELAVALENAQLFEKEHRLVSQQQALLDVFSDFSAEIQPAPLFQHIIERAIEVIPNAEAGSLVVPKGKHYGFAAAVGFDIEALRQITLTINDFTFLGSPIQRDRPIQKVDRITQSELLEHNKIYHAEQLDEFIRAGRITEIKSTLRAILAVGDNFLGSISVDSLSKEATFTEEDEQILLLFANQAAIAIHNAQLFEEISAAEANYRDLFDNANDLIFTLNANFMVSSANKAVITTTGYPLEELIGMHATRFLSGPQASSMLEILRGHLKAANAPSTFELTLRAKDGEEKLLEVTMRIRRRGGRPTELHFIARDMSRRRELEKQLRQIEKLSTIGKLVAGVAHELNNPLTSIIGYTNLLQESNLDAAQQGDLKVIARQAERARLIVRDLLTFARNIDLQTEPVDVNEVLQSSLRLVTPQLHENLIQVITRFDFGLPPVMADPHRLEQVFVNLMTNAVQELSELPYERRITLESSLTETNVQVSLADNGPGIPEQNLSRIFDPFFSTKKVGEGTGLGLSICFGIISQHQGRIWAENQSGGGTIFYIQLPLSGDATLSPGYNDAQKAMASSPPLPDEVPPPLRRILVVDDELHLLGLLERILHQPGYTIDTMPNGQSALHRLLEQEYDLIISDVLMPDMSGIELFQQVTARQPHYAGKFIFITGNTIDTELQNFLAREKLVWLAKPFLPDEIKAAVGQLLNGVQPDSV